MDLDATPATTVSSEQTSAEPSALWVVISDPRLLPQFSDELEDVRLDEPVAVGAHFEGVNRRGDATWTTSNTVTMFEPGSAFEWIVGPS
ncbi:MAG TPA: SRPBCC family protein, partial [Acidimicrobiales bacterium]|nr:SRPBCC family protein [Acidimicrobiales bacterium]